MIFDISATTTPLIIVSITLPMISVIPSTISTTSPTSSSSSVPASTTTTRQFYITGLSNRIGNPAIGAAGGTVWEGFIAQPQYDILQLGLGV